MAGIQPTPRILWAPVSWPPATLPPVSLNKNYPNCHADYRIPSSLSLSLHDLFLDLLVRALTILSIRSESRV